MSCHTIGTRPLSHGVPVTPLACSQYISVTSPAQPTPQLHPCQRYTSYADATAQFNVLAYIMYTKHPTLMSSSSSSECDFDIGFGEILEYTDDSDFCGSMSFTDPFSTPSVPSFEEAVQHSSSFDGKGKAPAERRQDLLRYHPETSKQEVVDHVMRSMSSSGQISAASLRHSSEQWSNYSDLCDAVKSQLRKDGYTNCTVECFTFGTERVICYELN